MNWYLIKKQSQFSSTFSQEKHFWTNGGRTTGNPKEKRKWVYIQILYLLTPFTRINTKCIIGLNVKQKTKKLLGDNVG